MFAVIKTGGKQYRVVPDQTITIERIEGDEGARVEFAQVLMVGEGAEVSVGTPAVEGARVTAEVVEQGRGPKVISFKKRRRQNSRRKKGHRQLLTTVSVLEILKDGASPSREASGRTAEDRRRERDAAYVASLAGVNADDYAGGNSEDDATGAEADDAGSVGGTTSAPSATAGDAEADAADDHAEEQAAMTASAPAANETANALQASEDDEPSTGEVLKEAAEGAAVEAAVGAAAGAAVAATAAVVGDDKPEGPLFEAPEGEKDKLTKIKGIGPVAERQLNEQGITTYAQIANLSDEDVAKVDAYMPFSAAQIRTWQEQARELTS